MIDKNSSDLQIKIKFRFVIKDSKTIKAKKLMAIYSAKFSLLMKKVMSTRLSVNDYSDLSSIRFNLRDKSSLNDILSKLDNILSIESVRMLLDNTPVFDQSPNDLKAFILLAMGVRSFNFIN